MTFEKYFKKGYLAKASTNKNDEFLFKNFHSKKEKTDNYSSIYERG